MNTKERARFRKNGIIQINDINSNIKHDLRKEWITFESFNPRFESLINQMNVLIEKIKNIHELKDNDIKKKKPLVIKVRYNPDFNPNHLYKLLVDNKFVKFIKI